jgi:PAS domain S-box-containing protein
MTTAIAAGRRLPSVATSVAAIAVVGAASLAVGLALEPHLPTPYDAPLWATTPAVAMFVLATAVAEIVRVPLMHDGAVEDLTFFEIVTVAAFLLLDPHWALIAPLLGLALVQVVLRKPVVKAAFNLGSYAAATTAAVVTYLLVCGGAAQFSLRGILGLLLGMGVFAVINTVLLAVILHAAQGVPMRDVITDFWALPVLMTFASVGVGGVVVVIAPVATAMVPFTLIPALALWSAYRSAAKQSAERARNVWLVTLSGLLAEERPLDSLVTDAAEAVRQAFGAPAVRLLMPEDVGVPLIARLCADKVADLPDAALPIGWGSGVATVLEIGAGRQGALLLGSDVEGARTWTMSENDAAMLTTVAASISSAIRGVEHRDALIEESGKLKAVVEHVSDGIAVINGAGVVSVWSPAMLRITGVTPADALAVGLPDDTLPEALVALRELAVDGAPRRADSTPLTITRPDGEPRDVSVNVVHARPAGALESVAILTVHDVTSQARADRLKSEFVATISHELRTPITPIKGYAQLLLARGDAMAPERRRAALELIAERADHLGRLVEDLLMASRASGTHTLASKLASDPTPHDLREVVTHATSNFPALAGRLTVQEPESPIAVYCDEVRAVQIVSNLVSNAAKYSPENAPIAVVVHPTEFGDTHARVDVVDHGQGIAQDVLDRVFERFFRVEDALTMRTSGSGLGLYIARELASAIGGTLTVTSAPGRGSTFTLLLPRTQQEVPTSAPRGAGREYARTA